MVSINHNLNYFLLEYTGYGDYDDSDCNETNVYDDIESVYDYAVNVRKIDPKTIIAYGRSLGSGPSCYIAEKKEIGGYFY